MKYFKHKIKHIFSDITYIHKDLEPVKKDMRKVRMDEHLYDIPEGISSIRPLAMLAVGEEARIIGVKGSANRARRLLGMGFTRGTRVRILSSNFSGPVLVDIKGSRIALGRGLAMNIMVDDAR
ncbi:FeoA family protein [Candidatus Pyrohabitans sp.]